MISIKIFIPSIATHNTQVMIILNSGLYLHTIIRPRFCLTIMEFCKNAAYLQRTVKHLRRLNYLTRGYFVTSISPFPVFCILLFPYNAKTKFGDVELSILR